MEKVIANSKLVWCEEELRALLVRLIEGNYHITAEYLFDHVAHSGVDIKLNPDLEKITMETFIKN